MSEHNRCVFDASLDPFQATWARCDRQPIATASLDSPSATGKRVRVCEAHLEMYVRGKSYRITQWERDVAPTPIEDHDPGDEDRA